MSSGSLRRWLPWPRSLVGQMLLLVVLALFVAQSINFALALRSQAQYRLAQATGPVSTRIADALDREGAGRELPSDHGRVRRLAEDPIPPVLPRNDAVAQELRDQLTELGVPVGRIDTGLRTARDGEDGDGDPGPRVRSGRRQHSDSLLIAVEQPGRGWLLTFVPWSRPSNRLLWALLFQTAVLFVVVLAPVLWIARRVARPLRALTLAARDFNPTAEHQPLTLEGPEDLRQVTGQFNALQRRVTAMLEEKDRMLGAIGHDLRTPLAAMRVRVESVEDDEDRLRMVDTIDEMNRTLDDILSLARLGRPSEPPTEVDLTALVDAVVEDFRDLDAPVTFEESARLTLRLRPGLMRRAVRNLIENAVKYGNTAAVRIVPMTDAIAIEVADEGPGIPGEQLALVFDPFTRLETSRNRDTGGIGLGLALARAIVRDAGGEITLTNRAPHGLLATIRLSRRSA